MIPLLAAPFGYWLPLSVFGALVFAVVAIITGVGVGRARHRGHPRLAWGVVGLGVTTLILLSTTPILGTFALCLLAGSTFVTARIPSRR